MKKKLTEMAVDKMNPVAGQRLEVFDTLTPGLALRITEAGKKSWSVMYRVAGRGDGGNRGALRRMTLGAYPLIDLKAARDKARAALELADRGDDPSDKRRDELEEKRDSTVNNIAARYVALRLKPSVKKWHDADRLLRLHVLPDWGNTPIGDIRRRDGQKLLDKVLMDHGPGIAREVRKHVVAMFNWAHDRDEVGMNVLAGMKRPDLAYAERERVLTMDELKAVWAAADKMGYPFGPMVRLLILTAQRRAEISGLRRDWLLPDQQAFEVPASYYKTDRPQVVPLSAPALAIVEGLPKWNSGEYLLSTAAGGVPVSGFSKAKARIDTLSGIEGWTLHDLRRSAATHMARLGIAPKHVEMVLGHATEGVAGIYNRYEYLAEKRAALDLWGAQWA
jgi:integrase